MNQDEKLERIFTELDGLDAEGLEQVKSRCILLLEGETDPDVLGIAKWLEEILRMKGVSYSVFSIKTRSTLLKTSRAILAFYEKHGSAWPNTQKYSLLYTMCGRVVDDIKDRGQSPQAQVVLTELTYPKAIIERMFPGYLK